jgi:hypothetical protein
MHHVNHSANGEFASEEDHQVAVVFHGLGETTP